LIPPPAAVGRVAWVKAGDAREYNGLAPGRCTRKRRTCRKKRISRPCADRSNVIEAFRSALRPAFARQSSDVPRSLGAVVLGRPLCDQPGACSRPAAAGGACVGTKPAEDRHIPDGAACARAGPESHLAACTRATRATAAGPVDAGDSRRNRAGGTVRAGDWTQDSPAFAASKIKRRDAGHWSAFAGSSEHDLSVSTNGRTPGARQ
jgi:hypothetical protein